MVTVTEDEKRVLRELGERLNALRLQDPDRSQRIMSEALGISEPTYRKMESGDPKVSIVLWLRAARLLRRQREFEQLLEPEESLLEVAARKSMAPKRLRARRRKASK